MYTRANCTAGTSGTTENRDLRPLFIAAPLNYDKSIESEDMMIKEDLKIVAGATIFATLLSAGSWIIYVGLN